jgi:hypothetical protein
MFKFTSSQNFPLFILPILFILIVLYPSTNVNAYDYSIDVSYQQAVVAFQAAVMDAVKDAPDKEERLEWAQEVSQRLPEFLGDMIMVSKTVSEQDLLAPSFEPFIQFEEKWIEILATCPSCVDLVPLTAPLVQDLLKDLPRLEPPKKADPPLANLYRFFQEMERLNPWNLGSFFSFSFLTPGKREVVVREHSQEKKSGVAGEKKTVQQRDTVETVSGETVFYEEINNDAVQFVSYKKNPITLLHEALDALRQEEGNTPAVRFWSSIVYVIDQELAYAVQFDLFDDFTYYYLFDHLPIKNEIVYTVHPLLNPQHQNDFKVAEFYPRTFYDPLCYTDKNCTGVDYVGFRYPEDQPTQ